MSENTDHRTVPYRRSLSHRAEHDNEGNVTNVALPARALRKSDGSAPPWVRCDWWTQSTLVPAVALSSEAPREPGAARFVATDHHRFSRPCANEACVTDEAVAFHLQANNAGIGDRRHEVFRRTKLGSAPFICVGRYSAALDARLFRSLRRCFAA